MARLGGQKVWGAVPREGEGDTYAPNLGAPPSLSVVVDEANWFREGTAPRTCSLKLGGKRASRPPLSMCVLCDTHSNEITSRRTLESAPIRTKYDARVRNHCLKNALERAET
jgi:hypothetical protein